MKVLKALHLIGLAMFLGSILAHISVGLIPGMRNEPATILIGRHAIDVATSFVTLPGLLLAITTGVLMTWRGGFGLFRRRWLTVHQAIGIAALLNALFVLEPIGDRLLEAAQALQAGRLTVPEFLAMTGAEPVFGAINLLLTLATVFIAAIRPRFGSVA